MGARSTTQIQGESVACRVDNEEGFDVLKRPYQKKNREDVMSGRRTVDSLSSFRSGYFSEATIVFQEHDEAF